MGGSGMEKILEIQDLRVSYHTYAGEVQSVRGVSFSIENTCNCWGIRMWKIRYGKDNYGVGHDTTRGNQRRKPGYLS